MNTIFWLAILVAVCGIGRFVLGLVGLVCLKYTGNFLEQAYIEHVGISSLLHWTWFFGGIAGVIVAITV